MQEIAFFIIAALLVFGIYKILKLIIKTFPESAVKEFLLSASGKVFMGFISAILMFFVYVFFMTEILGIHC